MKKIWKRIAAAAIGAILLTTNAYAIELSGEQEYVFIHDLVGFIGDNAKFPAPKEQMLDEAFRSRLVNPEAGFNGMVEAIMNCLDEHSSYLPEEEYRSFLEESVMGEFTGIGVTISQTEGAYVVVSPFPGSPAEKAGIMAGDVLVAIDDVNIENEPFDVVRSRILGAVGSAVKVTVRRGSELLSFTVLRAVVENEVVHYEIMDGVGYLRLMSFTQAAVADVEEALRFFEGQGIEDLILDLRDNPGGEMNAALEICGLFTPEGVLMRVEYADSTNNELHYNDTNGKGRFNLAVLVNGGSASASELLAGAIQDTASGTLIGTTTFGKGTVQTILPIISGGGIRLTVAEYKTAGGRSIHKIGVVPDIRVENTMTVADTSYMVPMELTTVWQAGDTGQGVLALEQRLAFWGYMEEADSAADEETAAALRLFQAQNGLEVTGSADVYTQIRLNDADYNVPVENDDQLDAAREYFNEEA